jgi:drug/metabolite transporter (DMT)-like permease
VPGLLLTALGMLLMMRATLDSADSTAAAGTLWRGVLYAVAAMASWTAFGLLNAAWLRRHPEVNSTDWANWLGIAAGVGALLLWGLWGSDWASLQARPGFVHFVLICAVTGIGSAYCAGMKAADACERVNTSNWSKFDVDGNPIFNENGKISKGPNYTPPDLTGLF